VEVGVGAERSASMRVASGETVDAGGHGATGVCMVRDAAGGGLEVGKT
jgi:hypothetical protein